MAHAQTDDKREFSRTVIRVAAEMKCGRETLRCDQTRDLSMNGMFFPTLESLPVGRQCRVVLYLAEAENPVKIQLKARVVRVEDDGIAIEFTEIQGQESYEHLRNLVLYNSSDPDRIEREFQAHVGLRRRTVLPKSVSKSGKRKASPSRGTRKTTSVE